MNMPLQKQRYGITDLILLTILSNREMYAYELCELLESTPLRSAEGLIYPALHRLRSDGYLSARRDDRRLYYGITDRGRAYLESEIAEWRILKRFVNEILREYANGLV